MQLSDMKIKCSLCKDYRSIGYADGHVSIGCMKASTDGVRPVDIVNMDDCPRSHKKKRTSAVDRMELLSVLGVIFTMSCPNAGYIALHELLKASDPTVKAKKHLIARALKDLNILTVVSRTAKGHRGVRCVYRWNLKEAGPPSLDMVDKINDHLVGLVSDEKVKAYNAKAVQNPIAIRHLEINEGTTKCESCWMRDTPDCRARLTAMGIDCKIVNVNTLRYEEGSAVG